MEAESRENKGKWQREICSVVHVINGAPEWLGIPEYGPSMPGSGDKYCGAGLSDCVWVEGVLLQLNCVTVGQG